MKIFIGMETSGVLRRRFQRQGHDVISCDRLPAEDDTESVLQFQGLNDMSHRNCHIVGDVFETLDTLSAAGWWPDLAIFHPDCTYLTNSAAWAYTDGPYHQKVKPGTLVGAARREARERAIADVFRIDKLKIRRKAMENPIGCLSKRFRKYDQIVQPNQFGDDASKGTCLWLWNLPKLPIKMADFVPPRLICADCGGRNEYDAAFRHGCGHCGAEPARLRPRWANQTDSGQNRLSPGDPDRWKNRSRTYPGIADAMVRYWGILP